MKNLLILLMLLSNVYFSLAQDNYTIEINGKTMDIQLGKPYQIELDGNTINFKVNEKEYLSFDEGSFSFEYKNTYKVVKTEIEEGISQYMIMDAGGSGILIQKYSSFNPSMLKELMLSEITKESLSYGYDEKRTEYERELSSGQKIKILKSELTYKGEKDTYEVGSYGKKDEGLIFLIINMNDDNANDLIDHFWKTLKIKD